MEPKQLAAFLTSLVSQLISILMLLFPSLDNNNCQNSIDPLISPLSSNSQENLSLLPFIRFFLSTQQAVASLSRLDLSRKRKRAHCSGPDPDPTQKASGAELGPRLSELLRVVPNLDSFKTFFNIGASTFEWLAGLLEPLLDCRDPVGSPLDLSAELRLGNGLFRLASGSTYPEIATRFGVTESVARFCARQLSRVLCTNFRFWVAFPNSTELESISKDFEAATGLPNCCGVVSCKRFNLAKQNDRVQDETLAVQLVVDSSSRILSVAAGFSGDTEDYKILKSTTLYTDIREKRVLNYDPVLVNGVEVNQYLIGDGRYPLLPWLMVPFADPNPGSSQARFNEATEAARVSVSRRFDGLRSWGVLSGAIEEEFRTAVAFVGACSMLHNVSLAREDGSGSVSGSGSAPVGQCQGESVSLCLDDDVVDANAADIRSALAANLT